MKFAIQYQVKTGTRFDCVKRVIMRHYGFPMLFSSGIAAMSHVKKIGLSDYYPKIIPMMIAQRLVETMVELNTGYKIVKDGVIVKSDAVLYSVKTIGEINGKSYEKPCLSYRDSLPLLHRLIESEKSSKEYRRTKRVSGVRKRPGGMSGLRMKKG